MLKMLLRLEQTCSVCGCNCANRESNEEEMTIRRCSGVPIGRYDYCPICYSEALDPDDKMWRRKVDRWIRMRANR